MAYDAESTTVVRTIVTAADIRAEHDRAIADLTPHQRQAIDRLRDVRQHSFFCGRSHAEVLLSLCEKEAQKRNLLESH